jgi:hypothetical protein
MRWSLAWLAVKGKPPKAVRDELGFRVAEAERQKNPIPDFSAAETPNGWYLIISNCSEQVAADEAMQRLSTAGVELVTCFVEEHVMYSSVTGWKDGQKRWSVIHNSQTRKKNHLETEGELPAAFQSILSGLTAQQEADAKKEGVDFIFDVPVELAQSLTGYRHDEDVPGLSDDAFQVLEVPASKGSVIKLESNLGAKWMSLKHWQRRVFGTLIILGFLALILFGVAFVFTYVIR